jgi:cyclomaltodextrinase / maltogenic alpha-amylase / neopullulanase
MLLFRYGAATLILALPFFSVALAQTIALDKEDATVWAQEQVISGTLDGASGGLLYVDGTPIPFEAAEGRFEVPVRIGAGETSVVACAGGTTICTEPRRLTLGFLPRPEAELRASVEGGTVQLRGEVLDNPTGGELSYSWSAPPENPAAVGLSVTGDRSAYVTIPGGAAPGEYYFEWTVQAADGGERIGRTFVTVHDDGSIVPFVLEQDRAAWIDRALIYGIAPYYFVLNAPNRLQAIREKLPELAELGVNTIWLQPIHPTVGRGHSYDVTDYFDVWSGFGTKQDLREVIETAHGLGMRVLLDLVPNHTSIHHPYAQDAIAHGPRSHYYDFYQREFDNAPYSRHYAYRHQGQMTFVRYFWPDLPNLNYHNPEVRRHMIEASRYWVEEFNVDGYRVDAPWGLDGRTPDFIPEWRAALKRIRPDLLLLGEDKATRPDRFENRYDVAYDWAAGEGWISQWMWQTYFSHDTNPTIFNDATLGTRARRLREAFTNFGQGWHPDAKVLRFMENNDTFRFIQHHSYEQTRMVATMLFSLPGIPLLYMGQEVGHSRHPFDRVTIFFGDRSIQSRDPDGRVYPFYQHLLRLRNAFPSLYSDNFAEIDVTPSIVAGRTFAYRRWEGEEHIVGAINMGGTVAAATLALPIAEMGLDAESTYYLTDLVTGLYTAHTGSDLAVLQLSIPAHTTILFAVADEPVNVPVTGEPGLPSSAPVFALEANYPNPFAGQTTIAFTTDQPGHVRLRVLDLLGREVAVLLDDHVAAGRQAVAFDASTLASGVYVYVVESRGHRAARRMTVMR